MCGDRKFSKAAFLVCFSLPSQACLKLALLADAEVGVCGPMGVSRLLLGGRKCERGMSIALIVSNPQRSEATSARRQGKAKSNMQGEGGVSACLSAMRCRYNSSTTNTEYLCVCCACDGDFWRRWSSIHPPLHLMGRQTAFHCSRPSMSYKCQLGAGGAGLHLYFPVDNLIEKVSLNTTAGGALVQTHAESDLSSWVRLTWLDAPLIRRPFYYNYPNGDSFITVKVKTLFTKLWPLAQWGGQRFNWAFWLAMALRQETQSTTRPPKSNLETHVSADHRYVSMLHLYCV